MKVCIIYKKSVYQKYIQSQKNRHLTNLYRKNHPLTRRFRKAHQAHTSALQQVITELQKLGIAFKAESRRDIGSLKSYNLIISVGGDGTFLRTAHHVKNQKMLGINSAPFASVGALLTCGIESFPKKIRALLGGQTKMRTLNRIEIRVNRKILPTLALNDILFSHSSPAGVTRYRIKIGKQIDEQRSSGIWIATAAGSTAAMRAAGGRKLPLSSKKIQYIIREPFYGKSGRAHLVVKGLVNEKQKIEIINQTIDACLYVDGTQTVYPLKFGDKIVLQNSRCPLRVIA